MIDMHIVIAADHAGYHLKELIKRELVKRGHSVEDRGAFSSESVHYPEFAQKAAEAVASGKYPLGVVICGTGIGVSITANKVAGIRAALCNDLYCAQLSREHNDANILAMGSRIVGPGLALRIVETFISTPYSGGRHSVRLKQIHQMEGRGYSPTKPGKGSDNSC